MSALRPAPHRRGHRRRRLPVTANYRKAARPHAGANHAALCPPRRRPGTGSRGENRQGDQRGRAGRRRGGADAEDDAMSDQRLRWQPLADACRKLVEAGASEAAAREVLTREIADWKPGAFLLGAEPDDGQGVGWRLNPVLDWESSLILCPWRGPPGSWQNLDLYVERRPTEIRVSMALVTRLCADIKPRRKLRYASDRSLIEEGVRLIRTSQAS